MLSGLRSLVETMALTFGSAEKVAVESYDGTQTNALAPDMKRYYVEQEKQGKKPLIVSGYIRKQCDYYEIPQCLVDLCTTMFMTCTDMWLPNVSNADLTFNASFSKFQLFAPRRTNRWRTAFGSIIVGAGHKEQWRLRINREYQSSVYFQGIDAKRPRQTVMIGVIDEADTEFMASTNCYFSDSQYIDCTAYSFYAWDATLHCNKSMQRRQYGIECGEGDMITIQLDMTNETGKISYWINDKEYGVAFDDVDVSKKYRLAVSLFFEEEVEIMKE